MARDRTFDIAVVGAGAVGLAAVLAFARDGFQVALVGRPEAKRDGRTVALLDGSVRLLRALQAWPALAGFAAPLEVMRLIDDTGSLFQPPPVAFRAAEIGLQAFGWNLESAELVTGLLEASEGFSGIIPMNAQATGLAMGPERASLALDDGTSLAAALVVAADGRNSRLRAGADIAARTWSYPQSALTVILAHERPHGEASTEFHTRHGPFTLVPLPGRRSSLVWVTAPAEAERLRALDDAALARTIERQAQSILGRITVKGPRGLVPMSGLSVDRFQAPRLALVGEAAHVFPPIGAQGLNLGFRDVAALRDAVIDARARGQDIGTEHALTSYQRSRDRDVRLRTAAVDGLNRTLLSGLLPADLLRGAGLLALGHIGPLRRAVMREGVLPSAGAPRLMQESAPDPAPPGS